MIGGNSPSVQVRSSSSEAGLRVAGLVPQKPELRADSGAGGPRLAARGGRAASTGAGRAGRSRRTHSLLQPHCAPPVASTPTDTLPLPASPGHGACWAPPSIIYTWEGKARMRGFFSRMG